MLSAIGIGFSKEPDNLTAAKKAVEEAREKIGPGRIDLAIIYHTVHYNPKEFLPYLYGALDKTRMIGTSTAAMILSRGIEYRGIAVLAIRSDHIKFEIGHVSHLHYQDIVAAGKKMGADCITEFGVQFRKLFLFFVSGLNPYVPQLIEGLKEQLGPAFPIFGAGSSDDCSFRKTYQIFQNKYLTDGAVGIILGGPLHAGVSIKHGWKPIGKPRMIDTVDPQDNHVIKTIDGQPAKTLYDEYFGDDARALGQYRLGLLNVRYPLGMAQDGPGEYLIRNVVKTLDDGSIVCQDNVIKDSRAHIMLGGKESFLESTRAAVNDVKVQLAQKKPELILVFESLMRYQLLQKSLKEDLEIIKKSFGNSVPIFGMCSMNEIFTPRHYFQEAARTDIHNGCIVMAAIL